MSDELADEIRRAITEVMRGAHRWEGTADHGNIRFTVYRVGSIIRCDIKPVEQI